MRVLIVEDDVMLGESIAVGLRLSGFSNELVGTLSDARHAIQSDAFDAVVLDVMLPDGSGMDLVRALRGQGSRLPILLLTARDRPDDRVQGLDIGADDYLGKPFDLHEVAARLRAIIRRSDGRATPCLTWNGFSLDPARMQGRLGSREIQLTRREFAILHALMEHPGSVLSRASLEVRVYGWNEDVESNAIEVHVHNLRSKIGAGYIATVRGLGYRLSGDAE